MSRAAVSETIPVIDIAPFLAADPAGAARVVEQVRAACEGIGFFAITGHGVPEEVAAGLYDSGRAFFALPPGEKQQVGKPEGTYAKGYGAYGVKTVGKDIDPTLKPSLQESFGIGPLDVTADDYYHCAEAGTHFSPNLWPARPPALRPAMTAYYRAMQQLSGSILSIFARILEVPDAYFETRMDRTISTLRMMHYPHLDRVPEAGEERAGAHTDTTAITILRIDDAPGGLQVRTPSGRWIDVPKVPGALIINIGDILMRWTNDRFVSTMHRVVNPPPDAVAAARISIAYFCMPNYDAVIECVPSCAGDGAKYPPVTSGDLLSARFRQTFAGRAEPLVRTG